MGINFRGRKNGFTLAEVLITLGIIGVVAALTMPQLIVKYKSMVLSSQLKKLYSVTSQAMQLSVPDGDYNNISLIDDGGSSGSAIQFFNDYMKPYFKTVKVCQPYQTGCWTQTYKADGTTYGSLYGYTPGGCVGFITQDGFNFSVDTWGNGDPEYILNKFGVNPGDGGAVIHVDINGMKKPNILGKDVFIFVMSKKGLMPAGSDKTDAEVEEECKNKGEYCFSYVMRNDWKISL